MGFSTWHWLKKDIKMKFIATACLIAAAFADPDAKADADASVLYGAYGYAGYAALYSLGYRGYAGAYAGAYGAYPYGHSYGHYIGKRSADAEPEADASVLYGAYGYAGYAASPYTHGYSGYAASPYAYGAYPYTYGTRYIGKRSADAEPEADASVLYGAYAYAASPYTHGYSGYARYPRAYGAYPYAHGAYSYIG